MCLEVARNGRYCAGAIEYQVRVAALEDALKSCSDRLETAAIAGGTDPEYAALAVKRYRELLV